VSSKWSQSFRCPHHNLVCTFPHPICTTCPTHIIILDLITQTIFGEEYRSLQSSWCLLQHYPVTLSILCPNILLNTLFSNTLNPCSSSSMSDQVKHPYKTTGKIIVRYILIFKFLVSKPKYRRLCTKWWKAFPDFSLLFISSWMEFWFHDGCSQIAPIQRIYFQSLNCDFVLHLLFSASTCRAISLPRLLQLLFFFIVCMLPRIY
jgi:hypothetical protein